jgi:hypothetical protein
VDNKALLATKGKLPVEALYGRRSTNGFLIAYQLGAQSFFDKSGSIEEFENFVRFAKGLSGITKPAAQSIREQSAVA